MNIVDRLTDCSTYFNMGIVLKYVYNNAHMFTEMCINDIRIVLYSSIFIDMRNDMCKYAQKGNLYEVKSVISFVHTFDFRTTQCDENLELLFVYFPNSIHKIQCF